MCAANFVVTQICFFEGTVFAGTHRRANRAPDPPHHRPSLGTKPAQQIYAVTSRVMLHYQQLNLANRRNLLTSHAILQL